MICLSARVLILVFFLPFSQIIGQSPFLKKQSNITFGYGFFNIAIQSEIANLEGYMPDEKRQAINNGSTFVYDHQVIGPLFFKYEYAAGNAFGIGLNISYYNYVLSETYTIRYNNSILTYTSPEYRDEYIGKNFSIGMRFNYHLDGGRIFDPYIGLAAGYSNYIIQEKSYTNGRIDFRGKEQKGFPLYFAVTLGARLDLTPWLGIYGEFGIDAWTLVQTGLNFRLNPKSNKMPAT